MELEDYIDLVDNKEYLTVIENIIKEVFKNIEYNEISCIHFNLNYEKKELDQLITISDNKDTFSEKLKIFYHVFYNKIKKVINDDRKKDFNYYNNLFFVDYLSAIDYKDFDSRINSNLITIKINNVDYLLILINSSSFNFTENEETIRRFKLIKHLYASHLNNELASKYINEDNLIINTKVSFSEFLSKISGHLPGFVYQFFQDPHGEFSLQFTSDKIKNVFGVSPESAYRNINTIFETIHPDDINIVIDSIKESAKNLTIWKKQFRIIKNGSEEWLEGEAQPEIKPDGSILWNGYITLISELMMLQQKIEESEAYKNSLLKAINRSVIVSIADLKGKIIEINQSFLDISKFTREEVIGKDHNIVNSGYHDKQFWYSMWKDIKKGKSWREEVKNKDRDGGVYWVDTVINPILNKNNKIIEYLSIRYDITSKKLAEFELIQLNKELENKVDERTTELRKAIYQLDAKNERLLNIQNELEGALKFKDQFLAIMAHDIKNSLTSITLNSDLIINYYEKMTKEVAISKSKDIKNTALLLSELLSELLLWSKSQSGNLEINIVHQDIVPLLDNLIKLYGLHNNPNFQTNVNLETNFILDFDYNIVSTVIRNLLSNAIKFSGDDGKISLSINKYIDYVEITVEDNGVGMTKEQINILLDINKSKKQINNSNKKGTGFGINLCIELINKHKGEFIVESTPNVGTKMTIVLPDKYI